jgi:5-methylcytosine-specific restriction endonuclease McrA
MTAKQFRSTHRYKQARARFLRSATVCAICGGPFVAGVPPRSRWAVSVDHERPLSELDLATAEGRALAMDQRYWRAAHVGCNSRRSGRRIAARARAALAFVEAQPRADPRLWLGSRAA